jgi:NAD(P)-binding Rossmann-like domain
MQNSRRRFFYLTAAIVATAPLYWIFKKLTLTNSSKFIPGRMLGAAHQRGHNILKMLFGKPSQTTTIGTVIIGGGISGLSAARQLNNNDYNDFLLLELEDQTGGNSRFANNKTGAFPLGAHYLPIPSTDFKELIAFLKELGLITHFDEQGLPYYDERYLCHDPEERLFINGYWQDGLVPNFGVPEQEKKQIAEFLALMNHYKNTKGNDGKWAFELPVDQSSTDYTYRSLDKISMKDFLLKHKFVSPYLHWYVEYCCKDDFGCSLSETSAWAGIHYFASRRGIAANATHDHVLTWPEGNGWLAQKLYQNIGKYVKTGCLVFAVNRVAPKTYHIDYIDYSDGSIKQIITQNIIFSCPQFVQKHIKTNIKQLKERNYESFQYSTWVTANAEVDASKLAERNGSPLSWDNVIYGTQSLGYINSCNQNIERHKNRYNFTWYYLVPESGKEIRKSVIKTTREQWFQIFSKDLQKVYLGFTDWVISCDVCVWGHAMVKPTVGFIWSKERHQSAKSIEDSLFFAHTDLSGMSLFEEGFIRGIEAANELMSANKK